MIINAIIPTSNRKDNILDTLTCLSRQESRDRLEWKVIVVDDNSTDGTVDAINSKTWPMRVEVLSCPPRSSWNASIPRNIGAKASDREASLLWFIDSDVLMPPNRLRRLADLFDGEIDKNRVILGPYHFCNSKIDITKEDWHVNGVTNYAADIRWGSFEQHDSTQKNTGLGFALACFGGHIAIPRKLFFRAGGYDEFVESGCEDGDFGLTLWETGATFTLDKGLLGFHQPHPILSSRTAKVNEMVKYLNEKHKINIVHESGKAYRKWGLDWKPPEIWLEAGGYTMEEFEKEMENG